MKTFLRQLLLSGAVALMASAGPLLRAAPPVSGNGEALYVTIGTDDPLAFDRFRYGFATPKVNEDLIIPTLRAKAPDMAQAAHWSAPIVVLNEDTRPPAGQPVLRLTWSDGGRVYAEYLATPAAKAVELGVVSRDSLAYHPTPDAALNRVLSATSQDAKRDENIRAHTEMQLYLALDLVEKHLAGR